MLVFISDLHFVDGTAGEHNLSHRAFEYFFEDVAAIATKPSNDIKFKVRSGSLLPEATFHSFGCVKGS